MATPAAAAARDPPPVAGARSTVALFLAVSGDRLYNPGAGVCCHEAGVTMLAGGMVTLPWPMSRQVRDWCPKPASLACTMACARSATCSLVKILDTWLRTVFWLRPSRVAIAALARP